MHRLNDGGVVCTHVTHGVSHEGFAAEWREVDILMVEGDIVNRAELFDEADLDVALAKFKELSPHEGRLEHPVQERFLAHFAARDWDAMGQDIADDYYCDDRRRVVNAGVRHGRDAALEDLRVAAEIGLMTNITSDIIATRGERLFLGRTRWLGADQRPEDFHTEILNVVEIDPEERIAAQVLFDPNEIADFAAAIAELDARYLAGDAVAYAHTWSLVADAFAAINRHELPKRSPDWVNVDHRRGAAFAAGEMTAYIDDLFDDVPDINVYAEVVHRLGNRGAVITQAGQGTSQEGFQAEWREIGIFVFDGDLLSRYELFDDADLDAALARFDELHSQARQPENAASQVEQRFLTYFAARDWDAYAEILTDDVRIEDRRHVVNAGVRHGRDSEIANVRALADIGLRSATSTVIAVRGERLFLGRHDVWGGWSDSEAAQTLCILEINAEHQIVARILFDPDDIDAAFTELEGRYLAGEGGAYAHAWSAITEGYAAFNRHELPAADLATIDWRRASPFESSTMTETLGAIWDLTPDLIIRIEAVHRLSILGAVVTHVQHGTSQEGFDAEWRMIQLLIVDSDRIDSNEMFDEADLDAALARFDELQPRVPRLENAVSQVDQRFWTHFAARDWKAMAELLADDISTEDRRRVVNAGVRHGRDSHIAEMRAVAEVGVENVTSTIVATRGSRLALTRICGSNREIGAGELSAEVLNIVEMDAQQRISGRVGFDTDDIAAAFEELDARYLAGEAAPYANTWTAVAGAYAAFNRHEIPAAPDWVNVDHRRGTTVGPGDMAANIQATWDVAPNIRRSIEAVHRLDNLGAVVTHTAHGTSREGFDAEWRLVAILMFEGDLISRAELFDEADLDAALARFDELQPQARRLENAATRLLTRYLEKQLARDWDAMAEMLADDYQTDDRRHVVSGGAYGREGEIANARASADVGVEDITATVIATRGERLSLSRFRYSGRDHGLETFVVETLVVGEINVAGRGCGGRRIRSRRRRRRLR